MKHSLTIVCCCIFIYLSAPAEVTAQDVYLTGGGNLTSAIVKIDRQSLSENLQVKPQWGVVGGASFTWLLKEHTDLTLGLLCATKGFEVSDSQIFNDQNIQATANMRFLYLDLPLTIDRYFQALHPGLFLRFGGFVGVGIRGTGNAEITIGNRVITDKQSVVWGSNEGEFPRMDYGGIGGVGFKKEKFRFVLSYQLGFRDIFQNLDEGQSFQNSVLMLTCDYKIASIKGN